jgi:ferredoxin
LKIEFASDRCVGHGQCYANAPEMWEPDDEGYSTPKFDVAADVPVELEAKARLSASCCPEYAITIVE